MRFSNKQGGGTQDGFDWREEKEHMQERSQGIVVWP
jgi:hypothetical protein